MDKLSKMLKIAENRHDSMGSFHNALYLGDVRIRVKILAEAGARRSSLGFRVQSLGMLDGILAKRRWHGYISKAAIVKGDAANVERWLTTFCIKLQLPCKAVARAVTAITFSPCMA